MANIVYFWAKFPFSKWPNIETIIQPSGHTDNIKKIDSLKKNRWVDRMAVTDKLDIVRFCFQRKYTEIKVSIENADPKIQTVKFDFSKSNKKY